MLKHKTFYFIIAAGLFEREWNANRESNTTQKKLTSNHILPSLSSKEKAKVKKRNIKFTQIVFNVKVTTCALSEKDLENHKFACFSYGGVEKETKKKSGVNCWIFQKICVLFGYCLEAWLKLWWEFFFPPFESVAIYQCRNITREQLFAYPAASLSLSNWLDWNTTRNRFWIHNTRSTKRIEWEIENQ